MFFFSFKPNLIYKIIIDTNKGVSIISFYIFNCRFYFMYNQLVINIKLKV
jgi:hypothetical protein